MGGSTATQLMLLLEALAAERDPPTAASEPAAALDTHVADGLSGLAVPDLARAKRIADLGAGAGFPGLVLAVALPEVKVDLIEAAGRKGAVIDRLIAAAKIENARSVVARAEEWAAVAPGLGGGGEAYEVVTARAVAALAVLVEYAAPLLRPAGVLVAWKGVVARAELERGERAAEQVGLTLEDVRRVEPFAGAENRRLVVFRKVADTPQRFPRRPGMAAKRPLGRGLSRNCRKTVRNSTNLPVPSLPLP